MHSIASLSQRPNSLAPHYARFRVSERLLLTGHSHQAWPDVVRDALLESFDDAAEQVDAKWARAFAKAEQVRAGFRRLLDDPQGEIVLGASTHDLLIRLLSSWPVRDKRRIVTTTGEFHTLRRQLARLEEEGFEIHRQPAEPVETLSERLAGQVTDSTLGVFVSAVLFESARIVPGLGDLALTCEHYGVPLVVDAYHALGAVPFRLAEQRLTSAYIVGGGYKYLQLGEGNCFLRLPPGCDARPVITGWFAEFDALTGAPGLSVAYGQGAARFAGATYDPASHYRAARVFDFFQEHGLSDAFLREVSQHQVGRLAAGFDALDLDDQMIRRDRAVSLPQLGGFLALATPHAEAICNQLAARHVWVDHRGAILRLGPAPYLCDAQLDAALAALVESVDNFDLSNR